MLAVDALFDLARLLVRMGDLTITSDLSFSLSRNIQDEITVDLHSFVQCPSIIMLMRCSRNVTLVYIH